MRWITGLLVAGTLAKKPVETEAPAAPAEPVAPAAPVPAIERVLSNPTTYAIKLIATCSPTGKDLVGRDQGAPNSYLFNMYGTGGLAVGQSVEVGPPEDIGKHIKGNRPIDVLKSLPVTTQEVSRSYAHRTAFQSLQDAGGKPSFDKNYRHFYFTPDKQILVTDGPAFSTEEIVGAVPGEMRGSRFRFVDGSDAGAGGQEQGIYMLADRLVGTALEARVSLELLNCGWEDAGLNAEEWLDLFSSVETALISGREQRYYALTYLNYAKEHHRDVYDSVMKNKPLLQALAETDAQLAAVTADYQTLGTALLAHLTEKGTAASWDEKAIHVGEAARGRYQEQRQRLDYVINASPLKDVAADMAIHAGGK